MFLPKGTKVQIRTDSGYKTAFVVDIILAGKKMHPAKVRVYYEFEYPLGCYDLEFPNVQSRDRMVFRTIEGRYIVLPDRKSEWKLIDVLT